MAGIRNCGQTKEDNAFWSGAKRCRRCVAQDRSVRARGERDRIQREFGTQTSVSGRRLRTLHKVAGDHADARIPVTARDRVGHGMLVVSVLGLFGGIILADESPLFFVLGLIIFGVVGWAGATLCRPRDATVSSLANTLLRNSVRRVDRDQQEYERFYLTADWRYVRKQVIERDGHVCGCCKLQIQDFNELTVDHIRPRSKYPELALVLSNLQVLCRRCNSSKGVR